MTHAGDNQGTAKMVQAILRRTALAALALVAVVAADVPFSVARAQNMAATGAPGAFHRAVKVGLNKSVVVDLPRDARDILVSNPSIADAVIRTARRIYITGVAVGQSNVIVFDRAGDQVAFLDLEVERDTAGLSDMLHRLIRNSDIKVEIISDNIVLSGTVRNASDSRQAEDIANIFANGGANSGAGGSQSSSSSSGGGASGGAAGISVNVSTASAGGSSPSSSVINMLTIEGEDQVHLKVTVAEVQRNIAKQLGIEMSGNISIGKFSTCSVAGTCSTTGSPFGVNGSALSNNQLSLGYNDGVSSLSATIKALEQTGMIKTLAEPTLTAISGETASFLAGGEYPVPTGKDQSGTVTIEFKPYGVALGFTPVVLSEGRISLRVKTEVSELTTDGSVTNRRPHHPWPQGAPCRQHVGASVRRLAGHGRHAAGQRQPIDRQVPGSRRPADPRAAVPQPRLPAQRDRAGDHRHALSGQAGGAFGTHHARRRLQRGRRRPVEFPWRHQPRLWRPRRQGAGRHLPGQLRFHHRMSASRQQRSATP